MKSTAKARLVRLEFEDGGVCTLEGEQAAAWKEYVDNRIRYGERRGLPVLGFNWKVKGGRDDSDPVDPG